MLNRSIELLMEDCIKIALRDFTSARSIMKIALEQRNSPKIRAKHEEKGASCTALYDSPYYKCMQLKM